MLWSLKKAQKTENVINAEETLNRLFPASKNIKKTQMGWKNVSLLINQDLEITILPNSVSKHSPRFELMYLLI